MYTNMRFPIRTIQYYTFLLKKQLFIKPNILYFFKQRVKF